MAATSTAVGAVPECNTSMYMQRLEGRTSEGGHGHKEGDIRSNECKQRGGRGSLPPTQAPQGRPRAVVCPQCGFVRRALRVLSHATARRRILRSEEASQSSFSQPAGTPALSLVDPPPSPSTTLEREQPCRSTADGTTPINLCEKV